FIAAAQRRAAKLGVRSYELYCEDIVTFCQGNVGAFDVAAALDFSEHIDDDEFVSIFSAVRMSLKVGGRLYLHTPNLDFFLERMRDANFILRQRPEHIAVRDGPHNISLLIKSGFDERKLRIRYLKHYNILKTLDPMRYLPVVGKYFEARIFIECTR